MSMLQMLESSIDELSDTNKEWMLFVQDHRRFILQNAKTTELTMDEMFTYEYRPEDFLKDRNLPLSMLWIFLWINQLSNAMQFPTIKNIIIPDVSHLYDLRNEYRTFIAQLNR